MATQGENATASSSNFEEEVKKLMGKGKVHLVCSEFMDAVKCFEEATKMLDEKHGEGADGCGEAYFYYGKSLLEVARMEGGVLGNALQGALDSNAQENGDDSSPEGKSEDKEKESTEEKPETSDKKADDKTKENDLFVNDEVDEKEKEKISNDVLDAMIEDRPTPVSSDISSKKDEDAPMQETTSEPMEEKGNEENASEEKKEDSTSETKEEKTSEVKKDAKVQEIEDKATAQTDEDSEMKDDTTSKSTDTAKPESKDVDMVGDKNETEEKKDDKQSEKEDKKEEEKGDNEEEQEEEGDDNDDNEEEGDDENMEDDGANEEEPTYMELAWNLLEMARVVFTKRDTKEGKLMLAQCHLKLGEIQLEQEQFMGAVEDFLKCLDIQKELLSADDRLIAETAYNIGLAFSFQSMHDKSKDYYTQALDTISLRIKSLQECIDEAEGKSKGKEKATPDNPLVANTKELKELQELYPEIKLKVDDAEEMMKQAKNKPDISSVMSNGGTTTIGFGDSQGSKDQPATIMIAAKKKPVDATDITHLVHRNKRKPEEDENDETAAKKQRPDPEGEANGKPESTNNNGQATTTTET